MCGGEPLLHAGFGFFAAFVERVGPSVRVCGQEGKGRGGEGDKSAGLAAGIGAWTIDGAGNSSRPTFKIYILLFSYAWCSARLPPLPSSLTLYIYSPGSDPLGWVADGVFSKLYTKRKNRDSQPSGIFYDALFVSSLPPGSSGSVGPRPARA